MFETIIENSTANLKLVHRYLADIPEEKMCAQFPGIANHPAWTVGHLAAVRAAASNLMGKPADLPPDWLPRFGRETKPVADTSAYLSKESLLATLEKMQAHFVMAFRSVDPAVLEEPHGRQPLVPIFPTKRHLIVNMVTTHDGMHLGQLSNFRRALGIPCFI